MIAAVPPPSPWRWQPSTCSRPTADAVDAAGDVGGGGVAIGPVVSLGGPGGVDDCVTGGAGPLPALDGDAATAVHARAVWMVD